MKMNRLTVLIVEDDQIQSKIVETRLRQCGVLTVEIAIDGQQALTKLAEQHFDLLLIDVLMDGMDGIELLNELHNREIYIPFYITSAINAESLEFIRDMAQQFQLPILGTLAKPLTLPVLQPLLLNLLPKVSPSNKQITTLLKLNELEIALANNELQLLFSSVKQVKSRRLESLAVKFSWQQKNISFDGSEIQAEKEQSKSLSLIALKLIQFAIEQLQSHFKVEDFPILSFKVSVEQLNQSAFFEGLNGYLQQQRIHKSCITFEINEHELQQGYRAILPGLTRTRIHGYGVAIGNIKTGYQSLLMIRELPISAIKLDPSLVINCHEIIGNKVLIASLIRMAKIESIKSIADGVERDAEIDTLRSFACDSYQSRSVLSNLSELIVS